ncbi:hypothetical protein niasHT_001785 [Heterodera trifolii]|uniref:Major sperm protein n=1 Tax=Heterodera trifolii TaxID=157864 RepID=A0ABD2MBI6_9BILA
MCRRAWRALVLMLRGGFCTFSSLSSSNTSSNALNDHTSSTHKASPTTATTTAMAQLPPEDVATMPTQKVVFNAPFDNKATYYMRVINPGTKRIGYAFKTTKPKRINMNPPNGVLGPKESVNVAISCDAFDPGSEDTKGDRVTVEWTNTPDPAATAFKLEWFQGDGMVRRKNLPIELLDNYVGRPHPNGTWSQPLFRPDQWNVYQRTLDGDARTNNNPEAEHHRLQGAFKNSSKSRLKKS